MTRDLARWKGRRLHFIGIGGAGMSGLALVCARLGAAVTGSDRSDSSYMERLRAAGLEPVVGHDATNLPEDAEVVVSTAISEDNPELALARERGIEPIHRGALLAELCAEKRLIAIAGTHGKTTTTAMTAWALRAIGADPAFFVGGEVPGLGPDGGTANADWGEGEWVVAEADESDASFLRLRPEVAVVTNVEMDHHSRWGSLAELREAFSAFAESARGLVVPDDEEMDWLRGAGDEVARFGAGSPGPAQLDLRMPGEHNHRNARAALAVLELAGFAAGDVAEALASFHGVHRRLELKGTYGLIDIFDDYAHHPTEVRAVLSALREMGPDRVLAVFQPHLYSRTKALAEEFGGALALADEVFVLDVYPAREKPVGDLAGVSGLRVARAAAERMGGRPVWWLPDRELARRALVEHLDSSEWHGDASVLVTIGAGDVYELGESLLADRPRRGCSMTSRPPEIERHFPLARLTTVRTGGDADWFARPSDEESLVAALRWADEEDLQVGVIGSGSNLLVADAGFHGLAIKLNGELAQIEREGDRVVCGGGYRFPSAAAKTAGWGLSGLEFGVNIPGTAGGAVRMNANAYGGELARVLEWVDVCTASGSERREPEALGFEYRRSSLAPGEVVARASFQLQPADPEEIRATLAGMRERRREAQPSGIKTFGSTFKNPEDPRAQGRSAGRLLEAAGCQGLRHGGARFSQKHANFVENDGGATTADVLELMAEGRRRVYERFGVELEPEVQILGEVEWPAGWGL
jgi:UDP-N-acetylmuramate--alanine ligase